MSFWQSYPIDLNVPKQILMVHLLYSCYKYISKATVQLILIKCEWSKEGREAAEKHVAIFLAEIRRLAIFWIYVTGK